MRSVGGCRWPGCARTRYVHGHHLVHWAQGGSTSLSNLVLLCPFHHRTVHENGVAIRLSGRAVRFTTSGGDRLTAQEPDHGARRPVTAWHPAPAA